MTHMQEPLIVYCFRHDGMSAVVLAGEAPIGVLQAGMLIEEAEMPEPDVAGLWAWVDEGSEPASALPQDGIAWRGHWRRLSPSETWRFAEGYRL